jgi:hypothetical protein
MMKHQTLCSKSNGGGGGGGGSGSGGCRDDVDGGGRGVRSKYKVEGEEAHEEPIRDDVEEIKIKYKQISSNQFFSLSLSHTQSLRID